MSLIRQTDSPQGAVVPAPHNAIPPQLLINGEPSRFGLGVSEIVVICVIGLLLFGGGVPTLARWLGRSILELKKGINDLKDEVV
jgi:TatA/E family protein of Tat protein translocase